MYIFISEFLEKIEFTETEISIKYEGENVKEKKEGKFFEEDVTKI